MAMTLHSPAPAAPSWTSTDLRARDVRLVRLPAAAVDALAAGDVATARSASGLPLSDFLAADTCRRVWTIRSDQLATTPVDADWVTRVVMVGGDVVGRAGFHGAPDDAGMVEVGYEIDPAYRRRGYARAALLILLDVARAAPGVRTLRATVSPDNAASRSLILQHGLLETGEQWDEEDGLEIIFEIDVRDEVLDGQLDGRALRTALRTAEHPPQ